MKRREFLKRSATLAIAGATGCTPTPRATSGNDNIVFIVVDQLRKDSLDRWAHKLSRLSKKGVRFEDMRSAAPWTYPSVMSLMSGLYPQQHGADGHRNQSRLTTFSPDVPLLQRLLKDIGYRTAGFVTNPFLHTWNPFHVGFDHFDAHFVKNTGDARPKPSEFAIPADMFAPSVNASIREHFGATRAREPEFTYVHYIDVHGPWQGAPFTPGYEPAVRFIDDQILELYDFFTTRYDGNVWFVVTSDHGRDLDDDLIVGYGAPWRKRKMSCHDFNTRIPFLILPSRKLDTARSISGPCSNVDVVPTIADIIKRKLPYSSPGASLLPAIRGREPRLRDRLVYSKVSAFGNSSECVIMGNRKLMRFFDIRSGKLRATRRFDLQGDPRETESIKGKDKALHASLLRMAGTHGLSFAPDDATLSDSTTERLKALGYLR
jgi:arylsulfatase A-like enzyme